MRNINCKVAKIPASFQISLRVSTLQNDDGMMLHCVMLMYFGKVIFDRGLLIVRITPRVGIDLPNDKQEIFQITIFLNSYCKFEEIHFTLHFSDILHFYGFTKRFFVRYRHLSAGDWQNASALSVKSYIHTRQAKYVPRLSRRFDHVHGVSCACASVHEGRACVHPPAPLFSSSCSRVYYARAFLRKPYVHTL